VSARARATRDRSAAPLRAPGAVVAERATLTTGLDSSTTAPLTLDALFERLCASARELCDSDYARIAFRDPVSGDILVRFPVGEADSRSGEEQRVYVKPGRGIGGQVLVTGRPARSDDLAVDERFAGIYDSSFRYKGPVLVAPARIDDQIEALLYVRRRSGRRPFTDRDELILVALADHLATTIRNMRLYNDLSRHQRVLEGLTRQLVTVQEAERKRLSREIHDEVGQSLSAVKVSLVLLLDEVQGLDASVRARVATAMDVIADTLREVRRISSDLRPLSLDTLGLDAALEWHVNRFVMLTGLPIELSVEGHPRPLDPEISTLLYRVTQEALTNVARHGAVTRAWVRLRYRESLVELTITDDGRGFDAEAVMEAGWKDGRFGLIGIRERVRQLGGTFLLSAAPGEGTRLMVEIRRSSPVAPAG
jgi:signal transduction histidine kinase